MSIKIALSKGRIFEETAPLLKAAGIVASEDPEISRKLIIPTNRGDVSVIIVRASDVPTYVQYGAAVFEEHILAGDAQVGCAILHIGGHVGSPHDNHAYVAAIGRNDQFARNLRILGRDDARRLQQRRRFFEYAPF